MADKLFYYLTQLDINELNIILDRIANQFLIVQTDIESIKTRLDSLESDVEQLKIDVAGLMP